MKVLFFVLTFGLAVLIQSAAYASTGPVGITAGIASRTPFTSGEIFYESSFTIDYTGGRVVLSSKADGTGSTAVDDVLIITVISSDTVERTFRRDYSNNCSSSIHRLPPTDLSKFFRLGLNRVRVLLMDKCGSSE